MNTKEIDNYIYNAIIMSTDRTLPLEFSKIILNTLARYGFDDNDLSIKLKATLKQPRFDDFYKNYLLNTGYIKRLDTSPDTFILTTKGIDVQNAEGLTKYLKKRRINSFFKILKKLIIYLVTPLLAIISITYPMFKKDKPIEIKQPIILHIDNLSQDTISNKNMNNNTKDSTSTNKNN
jgi:hypothetical protein